MVEIFTLQEDLSTTQMATESFGMVDRRRSSHVMLKITVQFSQELGILHITLIGDAEFFNGLHERFSYKDAPIRAKMATRIRVVVHLCSACFDSQILAPH